MMKTNNFIFKNLKNISTLNENEIMDIFSSLNDEEKEMFFNHLAEMVIFDEKKFKFIPKKIKLDNGFKWQEIIKKTSMSLSKIPENHLSEKIIHDYFLKFMNKNTSDKDIEKAKKDIEKIKNQSLLEKYTNSNNFKSIPSINKFLLIDKKFLNNGNVFPSYEILPAKYSLFQENEFKQASFDLLEKHIENNKNVLLIPHETLTIVEVEYFLKYYPYLSDLLNTNLIYQNKNLFLEALKSNVCFLYRKDIPNELLLDNDFIQTLFDNHLFYYSRKGLKWENGFKLNIHPYALYFNLLKENNLKLTEEKWKIILSIFNKAKNKMRYAKSNNSEVFDDYFISSLLNILNEDIDNYKLINLQDYYEFLINFYKEDEIPPLNLILRIIFKYFSKNEKFNDFNKTFYPFLKENLEKGRTFYFYFDEIEVANILKPASNEDFCFLYRKLVTWSSIKIDEFYNLLASLKRYNGDLKEEKNVCFLKLLSKFNAFYTLPFFKTLNPKDYGKVLDLKEMCEWINYIFYLEKDKEHKEDYFIELLDFTFSILEEQHFQKEFVKILKQENIEITTKKQLYSLICKKLIHIFYYYYTNQKMITKITKEIKQSKYNSLIENIIEELYL